MTRKFQFLLVIGLILCTSVNAQQVNLSGKISLNGLHWRIAADSLNKGKEKNWFLFPPEERARISQVPWVIQDIYHDYHGVAWYWREFEAPVNPHVNGRYILRFMAVDYLAEVWVNGTYAGVHEGSETPFELDVTSMVKPASKNLLVVRVLNPAYEPIDGLALKDTPSGAKQYPFTGNAAYNSGGIVGDVELLVAPCVRFKSVFVSTNWKSGSIKIGTALVNCLTKDISAALSWKVSDVRSGNLLISGTGKYIFREGDNSPVLELNLPDFKLWSPDDPVLYRLDLSVNDKTSEDDISVRFGFRDFRFENGYFRLNGKRIFLNGANFSTHFPVGFTVPLNESMLRRDVINLKAMGFNFVRIPFGCPNSRVLDIYDELGILVQQEHFGCWQLGDYGGYKYPVPENNDELLQKRFENSITGVIIRDRNHPCLVMWGVLNENSDGPVFRKAVSLLPVLRSLHPSGLFVLNSGRFDGRKDIGSMSNPGSADWDVSIDALRDWHPYVWIPYSPEVLDMLSGKSNSSGQRSYISETGLCFPIDLPSELGDYQLAGKENSDDAVYYRRQYDKFLTDWEKFRLGECWATQADYMSDAYKTAAVLREMAESAIRSNPYVISYTPTNGVADAVAGESMATNFRRIKPDLVAPVLESNEKLRWCLRTEPQSIYSGDSISFMVSLSDLDVLPQGKYSATIRVLDPHNHHLLDRKIAFSVPGTDTNSEQPYAQELFSEKIRLNSHAGTCRLFVSLDKGATVPCGLLSFFVSDREPHPALPSEVTLCGSDPIVENWLTERGVRIRRLTDHAFKRRELILMAGTCPDSLELPEVACRMARGSTVVFLSPATFGNRNDGTRWLPLIDKGSCEPMDAVAGYYRADRWVRKHPLFEGMPSGGMMDYVYYRNLISMDAISQEYTVVSKTIYTYDEVNSPLNYPTETVCGATRISHTYCSGIHVGIWNFLGGKFIANTLHITENLGRDPAADRLFANILKYGSADLYLPVVPLPSGFDLRLESIGYKK
jgi:hypothetical protein